MRKMTANNPNLDLVNINAYIKFGEFCQFVLKTLSGNVILAYINCLKSGTNVCKMLRNNPKLDLVNINAYIKSGGSLSICS